ncbi:hypothetical protein ABFX02_08G109400 [Erythranthe guttata]
MQSHGGAAADQSPKPGKKPKSREVSSRFLSPTSNNNSSSSPNSVSPLKPTNFKPAAAAARSSTDSRKHKSFDHSSGFLRGLWPSSKPADTSNTTLADHLGRNDRLTDNLVQQQRKTKQKTNPVALSSLGRQRSCTEFSRFGQDDDKKIQKENHKPAIFGGGSMRYTATSSGNFKFPAKSSSKSSINDQNDIIDHVVPGRFSVDETAIRRKSSARGFLSDSESEYSDALSAGGGTTIFDTPAASYMAPTVSSRKHGIEVPSKFMHDLSSSRSRRWSADNSNSNSNSSSNNSNNNNSPKIFSLKSAMKGTTNNNGSLDFSPTNTKPPTSPSKGRKGVGNILSMGIFELLKGKKSSSSNNFNAVATSPLGPAGSVEKVHELRLLHNSLMQWRYANARAQLVNGNVIQQAERKLVYVWDGLIKLRQSVLQKKLQLQKEKLKMKLNYILHSHMKALEMWGNMEKRHLSAVSTTKDHLHSVVCRIPLVDGAKVEQESASNVVRHASHVAASIDTMITTFSPAIEKTVVVVAELATVVSQEKLLLQECFELFSNISALEIEERSLKGSIMQLRTLQQQPYV